MIGRICIKTHGREKGRKCVIVDVLDNRFVLITGPKDITGVRRRLCNLKHLEMLSQKIAIPKGASDDEVKKALEAKGLLDFMKEPLRRKPSSPQ